MLSIEKLDKLSRARCRTFAFLGSFLLIFAAYYSQNLSSNTSATSPSTISGSDTAPVSVSVSNSPLAYYISVSSSHGSAGTPVSLNYSQDGST
ncbi:hypothetical protein IKG54_02145, partial [Candidatus Saccharibacteria bacterium]|nr:hypothetical protein [Candidatus Saccharibacteria bacterium]